MFGTGPWGLSASLILGFGVALVGRSTGALTRGGALGAGGFAASLVGLGGWTWAVPGAVFFALSSALSFLPGGPSADGDGPRRTLRQVLANGGVAWGLLVLSAVSGSGAVQASAYAGFVGSLAAAAADTWATELGVRYGGRPWSLRTKHRVEAGTSGAVSVGGTFAGLAGAATVAGSALGIGGLGPGGTVACTVAGVGGMATDGWAGATLQARYRDPETDEWGEQPRARAELVRGCRGIDNDGVNLLGALVGAALAAVLVGFGSAR